MEDNFFKMGCKVCRGWFRENGATGPVGVVCSGCGTSGIVGESEACSRPVGVDIIPAGDETQEEANRLFTQGGTK